MKRPVKKHARAKKSTKSSKTGPPPATKVKKTTIAQTAGAERLQKVLAAAGHGSRRACEELILAGRVDVDGKVADVLGTKVDPTRQEIRVDSVPLPKQRHRYYLLNKPTGVVSTNRDPSGRMRVIDLVPADQRLFTVGRLDMNSEGLILVTNDGELANELTHPRYGVEKIYEVEVAGKPEAEQLRQLRTGIYLAEAFVKVENVRVKKRRPHSTVLEINLKEGRNREIRRILARIGHKVLRLRRIAIGPLKLADLPSGAFRELKPAEVEQLRGQQPQKRTKRVNKRPSNALRSGTAAKTSAAAKTDKRPPVKKKPTPLKKKPTRGRR